MMKKFILMLMLLLPVTGFAETIKIGVVDVMRLFSEYKTMTGIDDKLQSRFATPNKELETLAKEIEAEDKKLKANEVMLTESKNKKIKDGLVEKMQRFNEKKTSLSKEVQAAYNQELATFRELVMGITQKFAKEENYTLITQADGVMYVDEEYNVTVKILTRLKAELPKK